MDFIRKNKFTVLALTFFVLFFILIIGAKDLFVPNTKIANYGDRLDGIKEISKDEKENINTKIKEKEFVKDASVTINGKILNVLITVSDDTTLDNAKSLSKVIVENISDEVKTTYDVQVFIAKDNKDQNNFPIIGYKHFNSEDFSWSRDREIQTNEGE